MCVLSVDTSSSPADPNMSTRPPGQPSLKPSMKTACLNRRKDGAPTRSDVESVEMVLATSLWMTDPNTASHASEYLAALWSSFLKWRMSNSRAPWMWERVDGGAQMCLPCGWRMKRSEEKPSEEHSERGCVKQPHEAHLDAHSQLLLLTITTHNYTWSILLGISMRYTTVQKFGVRIFCYNFKMLDIFILIRYALKCNPFLFSEY